jgi:DNA-binding GntR family transcriptional regulator
VIYYNQSAASINTHVARKAADKGTGRDIMASVDAPMPLSNAQETLAERAYRLLEDEIVRLRLTPGTAITEQQLAARLSIGRTPVREAIQRLVGDGLLVVFRRKGILIADINPLDVFLALDVRAGLERLMVSAASERASPQQQGQMQACIDAMVGSARAGEVDFYMQLDKQFDRLIAQAAANPFAERAAAPLQTMSRRAWFFFRRSDDLGAAAARHAAIMAAIAAGDKEAAGRASDQLIAHIRAGLRQSLSMAKNAAAL